MTGCVHNAMFIRPVDALAYKFHGGSYEGGMGSYPTNAIMFQTESYFKKVEFPACEELKLVFSTRTLQDYGIVFRIMECFVADSYG